MAATPTDPAQRRPIRPTRLAVVALGIGLTVAGAAQARQAAPSEPRYLSWANRTTSTTPPAASVGRAGRDVIPRRVAPSQSLSRPAMQPFNPPMPVSDGGLTPASAWIGPRVGRGVAPAFVPSAPDPLSYATTEMAAAPPTTARAAPPVARPVTAPTPPTARPIATAATTASPAPPTGDADADPMAPRRDAPIFRLQSQGEPVAAEGITAPPPSTPTASDQPQARYYSVHRAAGRQPDPTVIPEPVFFDSVALDLAAPPEMEPLRRDAQGRVRPAANAEPSLP